MSASGTPCDLLIIAGEVLPQDAERRRLSPGAVAVDDGTILAVGPADELRAAYDPRRTLDLGEALLLPGLVNAHTHASMTLFRGFADDLPLMAWLTEHVWPVEAKLSAELVHLGALAACCEMARTGSTCFMDMYLKEEAVGRAASAFGLRAVVGEGFFSFPSPLFKTKHDAWDTMRALHERFVDDPLVRTAITPHSTYATDPDLLRESLELAEEFDAVWSTHCAESADETAQCLDKHGKRPLALLADHGLLGPRTLLAHCVDITDEEVVLLADTGTCVAHCPQSNLKLGNGMAPIQRMLEAEVTVALGTDGASSNNDLNLFGEMQTAALLQKGLFREPTALTAATALDMATRQGAEALNWPGLGRLEPGAAADMTALDLTQPNLLPCYEPASHAVYAATGHEVRMTMVAGRVVFMDGEYPSIDYPALRAGMAEAARWMLAQRT